MKGKRGTARSITKRTTEKPCVHCQEAIAYAAIIALVVIVVIAALILVGAQSPRLSQVPP